MQGRTEEDRNVIYVSANGPVREIQSAIKLASEGSVIRVANGYYKGFVVTKQGITIEADVDADSVIIIADKGDSIRIDYEGAGDVVLRGLKVSHTAAKAELNFNKMIKYFLNSKKSTTATEVHESQINQAKSYNRNISIISLLRVIRGSVKAYHTTFSYKIMTKSVESITPAVILEQKTKGLFYDCEIVGHKTYPTLGILSHKSDLSLEGCRIYGNLSGGATVLLGNFMRPIEPLRDGRELHHEKSQVRSSAGRKRD